MFSFFLHKITVSTLPKIVASNPIIVQINPNVYLSEIFRKDKRE